MIIDIQFFSCNKYNEEAAASIARVLILFGWLKLALISNKWMDFLF